MKEEDGIVWEYLGYGVYAGYDGYGIYLHANDHEKPTDRIYLEPEVFEALVKFHGDKEQPWPGPEDILEMRGKEQSDEWEEWAEAAAHVLVVERYYNTLNAQELKVKEVLCTIPCNPRRKP